MNSMQFDYIIIGAGSSGCVLAARLSEHPENRVLVLEAGGDDAHLFLRHAQKERNRRADHVRHLGGGVHHQLFGSMIPFSQYRNALHGEHALARQVQFAMHDPVCLCRHVVKILVHVQRNEHIVFPARVQSMLPAASGSEL